MAARGVTYEIGEREALRVKISQRLALRKQQQTKSKARGDRDFRPFRLFVRDAWHVIEPGTALSWNWHMDHICDHLEAIACGVLGKYDRFVPYDDRPALDAERYQKIRNLVINVPPRSTKSIIISVMWPAHAWGEIDPRLRFLYSSYSLPLSLDHSRMCRDVIKSEWYQELYGDRYRLREDHDTASDFANNKGGRRQAISTDSATTGKGGHILVADDPHNVIEGESEADRKKVKRWFTQAFSSRRNDPAIGARVVVMQRIHQEDLSGILLADKDRWERLIYRQEYEPPKDEDGAVLPEHTTALGYQDKRTEPGDLLWPERFTPAVVADAKVEMGSYGYAGQHQQRPSPLEGGIFKRGWWQRWSLEAHRRIDFRQLAIFLDTAQKDATANDYSAFLLAGIDSLNDYYFLDAWHAKVEYPELVQAAYDFWLKHAKAFGKALPMYIEDKSSGISLIQTLSRGEIARDPTQTDYSRRMAVRRPKIPAMPFQAGPKRHAEMLSRWMRLDKLTRAQSVSPIVEAGRVWIPQEADWANDFLTETSDFPNAPHDEYVDLAAMAIKRLGIEPDKSLGGIG
jgi:phage terminase large subunit-like protein